VAAAIRYVVEEFGADDLEQSTARLSEWRRAADTATVIHNVLIARLGRTYMSLT
jgi:hypothetical protein